MRAERDQQTTLDGRVAALAARQYGVVTRRQLHLLGAGRGAIAHRVKAGRLHRLYVGVYAVGHAAPRQEMHWLAAVLACGPDGALSHRSGAALWAVRDVHVPRPDVTVPSRSGRTRRGIVVHRAVLPPQDVTAHRGIPVTSPARTLADMARVVDHDELVRLVREFQFVRRFDIDAVREVLARRPHRGLRAVIEDLVHTESRLEDRLLAICDRHGIERPVTQHRIEGRRIDFVWPRRLVAVETDGWQGHGTRSAFQTDRTVSNRLQLRGYTILRFTDADLRRRPAEVARQLRAALDRAAAARDA